MVPELRDYRGLIAFEDTPTAPRFWSATPAALVGLKGAAFGRTRPDGSSVDRDFSDVVLLLDRLGEHIAGEVAERNVMRSRVESAAERLLREGAATEAAARELVSLREYDSQRVAELAVRRTTQLFLRRLRA